MFSKNAEGEKLILKQAYSDREEALIVCNDIQRIRSTDRCEYSDFAILYRTNSQSRSFEESMRKAGIPYKIYGGLSFYQRKEIKDIIAYFRLVANPSDEEAFKRIINYPKRGIGDTTVGRIISTATEKGASLWDVISAPQLYNLDVSKGTLTKIEKFRTLINGYIERSLTEDAYSLEHVENFPEEIAASRTFVFVREIEPLVKGNLIKGGDLDNAIVIYDSPMEQAELDRLADLMNVPHKDVSMFGYINNIPLTSENEPARHKLLDLIGDLALIGRPLKGRVIATRPGHSINTTFAKRIRREIKHQEVQAPVYNPDKEPLMDNNRIRELIPHRYPFLLVDKIIEKGTNYIVGVKNITANEPFFQGHFPQEPVLPGVLQVEAMAQTGGILVLSGLDEPERYSTYFMKIDNVKFRQKVVPGDTLVFHVSFMTELRRGCAMMKGYAFVGEKIVTECEFMAQIIKNK